MNEQLFLIGDEAMNEEDAIQHFEDFAFDHVEAHCPNLLDYLETIVEELVLDETHPYCELHEEAIHTVDCIDAKKSICEKCEHRTSFTKETGKKFKFVPKITFEIEEVTE